MIAFVQYYGSMDHEFFMHRCLELAEVGRQDVGNGAMVGAVLVREGKIVAEAFHIKYGYSHAERTLLEKFDQEISTEDTLYVSLEPCCHYGKTPPCIHFVIERGVKNVVVGMLDPDPRVSGKGIATLREAGVNVTGPVLPVECGWLNRGFVSVRSHGRPWITLKVAKTPEGKVASNDGSRLIITGDEQDRWAHEHLRSRHDAILVGVQTIINDDPVLDARLSDYPDYHPWRIVLDPNLRIPATANVMTDAHAQKTIIITSRDNLDRVSALQSHGAMVLGVEKHAAGFHWPALWEALLSQQGKEFNGLTSILVEGGARTWEAFEKAGMVDMEVMLVGSR